MSALLVILIGAVLINTFLLMQNDASLSGTRRSGSVASGLRIAGATAFVLIISSVATSLVWRALVTQPSDAILLVFSLIVVAIAFLSDRIASGRFELLARSFASSPLLIVGNSLALGTGVVPLVDRGFAEVFLTACALAISFAAALALFVPLIARITPREVPASLRGAPITLVSAGLFTLALMGITGLLRG